MRLYDISNEFKAVMELAESGELSHEDLLDTIEAINLEFDEKAKNCLMMLKQFENETNSFDSEIKRLEQLKKLCASRTETMKEYLRENMQAMKRDKLDVGLFKVTLKAPSKAVEVLDESKIPAQFWVTIPESKKLDKSLLASELKLNKITGAQLVDGKRALLIR